MFLNNARRWIVCRPSIFSPDLPNLNPLSIPRSGPALPYSERQEKLRFATPARGQPCAAISRCFSTSIRPSRQMRFAALPCSMCERSADLRSPQGPNEAASVAAAIDEIAEASLRLLGRLETVAPPRSREEEAAKAKARGAARFRSAGAFSELMGRGGGRAGDRGFDCRI